VKTENSNKPEDIRSLAADLIYGRNIKTPEGAIVALTKQAEKDVLWAIKQFEDELFVNRISKMDPEKEESIKRSVILDAVLFSLRHVKEKVKEKYKIEINS